MKKFNYNFNYKLDPDKVGDIKEFSDKYNISTMNVKLYIKRGSTFSNLKRLGLLSFIKEKDKDEECDNSIGYVDR